MTKNIRNKEASVNTVYSEGFEFRQITTDPDTSAYRSADTLAENYKSSIKSNSFIDKRNISDIKFASDKEEMSNCKKSLKDNAELSVPDVRFVYDFR